MSDQTDGQLSDAVQEFAAAWHADPFQRFELRYYDGKQWTDNVSTQGNQAKDPPVHTPLPPPPAQATLPPPPGQATLPPPPGQAGPAKKSWVDEHDPVQSSGAVAAWQGGGHLMNEPILVVSQKAQLFEVNQEYAIRSADGAPLGWVMQVGQSAAKKAMRVLTNMDNMMTHHLDIVDANHNFVMRVTRPAKMMKSKVIVQNAQLQEIGQVVQKNLMGKINFDLVANGQVYGAIKGENWRAWNFRIEDHTGTEVARITKTWEGIAKAFTTADNYVIHIHRPLEDPLRSLVVASSLSVDLALKQQGGGLG